MRRPRFDIEIPNCREGVFVPPGFATPEQIIECVQSAERLGYHAVWATDFVSASPSSGVPSDESPAWYEPIVTLSYAAAVTSRIKLGKTQSSGTHRTTPARPAAAPSASANSE